MKWNLLFVLFFVSACLSLHLWQTVTRERLPFRCRSEGWMFLTISNWFQGEGWLLDLNLGKLSQVGSEIVSFFFFLQHRHSDRLLPVTRGYKLLLWLRSKLGSRPRSQLIQVDTKAKEWQAVFLFKLLLFFCDFVVML